MAQLDNRSLKAIMKYTDAPVAAGRQGRYVYAGNATALDLAFTRVASEILRLAR